MVGGALRGVFQLRLLPSPLIFFFPLLPPALLKKLLSLLCSDVFSEQDLDPTLLHCPSLPQHLSTAHSTQQASRGPAADLEMLSPVTCT